MNVLNPQEGLALLALFGITMIGVVRLRGRPEHNVEGFLVAGRTVGLWQGAFSTAVSWVWAPAIFICSLQAYTQGLPGVLWFTLPNVLCFFLFAPFALKLRRQIPHGYTLPEFIFQRFQSKSTHVVFLVLLVAYQCCAILINSLAGGTLLHAVSGIDINFAIVSMTGIALTYSLIRGLKASIFTDVLQMTLLLFIAFVIVPLCFVKTGGLATFKEGLGGVSGDYRALLHPGVAFAMGIPMTISLLSGPFVDQMFFQRALALQTKHALRSFIYAGLIFALVPITLSLLGFMGAGLVRQGLLVVNDPQMVGPTVIAAALPKVALYAFCLMAFAGLCSTMDSSLCALSSLGSVDIYKRYLNPAAADQQVLRFARRFMIGMAILGTSLALLHPKLLWVFLSFGAIAGAAIFPVMFAIGSRSLSANAAAWSVGLSLLLGTPLSIYANVAEHSRLIVLASLLSVGIGFAICSASVLLARRRSPVAALA